MSLMTPQLTNDKPLSKLNKWRLSQKYEEDKNSSIIPSRYDDINDVTNYRNFAEDSDVSTLWNNLRDKSIESRYSSIDSDLEQFQIKNALNNYKLYLKQ